MIINKISIMNYGLYYGENTYDFSTDSRRNIILIGGKNGTGKTTLLETIKLSIYGSLIMNLKNPNKIYYNYILRKFNVRALNEGIKEASIKIEFEWSEKNNTNIYEIERIWFLKEGDKLIEDVNIKKNNENLDSVKIEDIETYFRTVFPQKLFDFFFFDGENITKLISGEYLEKEVKEATHTLFGIDTFKSLNTDLTNYINARLKSKALGENQRKLAEKIKEKEKINSNYNSIETRITEDKIRLDEMKLKLKNIEKRFKKLGGDIYRNRSEKEIEINMIERKKQEIADYLKENIANFIPFYINKNRMKEVVKQIEDEKVNREISIFKHSLENPIFKSVFEKSFDNLDSKVFETFKAKLIKEFSINNVQKLHSLSYDEIEKIKKIYEVVSTNYKKTLLSKTNDYRLLDRKLTVLREELISIRGNKDIEIILKEISNLNNEIVELNKKLVKENDLLKKEEEILNELNKEISEIKNQIIGKLKDENKTSVVTDIQSVLKNYVHLISERKLKIVKSNFIEMFNKLHRKKGFIKDVQIDSKTLEIKLYHKHGLLDNRLLSAGEKQVYILSLLLAFLKASNQMIPLVFDTLLGRLDKDHRENIIKEYLPNASKQVLILSTDSEITIENYRLLKKYIAKEYTNNFNISKQELEISNSYFM